VQSESARILSRPGRTGNKFPLTLA